MATIKRTNPGDAANIFVRCILSDISDLLGGCSQEDIDRTVKYFDYKCPYTGDSIYEEYLTGKWVLDHLIPHNRESAGLNLYGNLIVTTKETNAAKRAISYEDFIRSKTKGSNAEKEARIQKIRNFQKESGYFDKIKNIGEIKDFCQKEYDFIQNRLQENEKKYEKILGIERNTSIVSKSITSTTSPNERMDKHHALKLFKSSGLNIYGQITFASQNTGNNAYWANPKIQYVYNDWWLILNDISKKTLHALFIPANSINQNDIVVRPDKPETIDLKIDYFSTSFMDKRSKVPFGTWWVKSINY